MTKRITDPTRPATGRISLQQLIDLEIAPILPKATLAKLGIAKRYKEMREHGFMDFEIRHILTAGNLPELFASKPYEAMLQSRKEWTENLLKAGWTHEQITMEISRYYSEPKHSPFDFLRKEYKPPMKMDFRVYREAATRRAEQATANLYQKKPRSRRARYGNR